MSACRQCGFPNGVDDTGLCANCRKLKVEPDPLSKRTTLGNVPFVDMKQLDEEKRWNVIAEHIKKNPGKRILVMVDTGIGYDNKGDRYVRAIRERVPGVKLVERRPGPVANGESIVFQL